MHNRTIRVFEHQTLRYGQSYDGVDFARIHFDLLARFNERHQNKFFTLVHRGIKFSQHVGVIQAGDVQIEILPKTDRENSSPSPMACRNVLIHMLHECRLLKLDRIPTAALHLRNASLFDLYLQVFLAETRKIFHQGLAKRYRWKSENLNTCKGKILFAQDLRSNLVHRERIHVRYQYYDNDHLINQILYQTLIWIPRLTRSTYLSDQSRHVLLYFPELEPIMPMAHHFDRIRLDRKTERYRTALDIARMFWQNLTPDVHGGNQNVISILFDMNELFEEYVYRQLKKLESVYEIKVSRQQSRRFWETRTIRPDIVLESGGKTIVLDTKWKILSEPKPHDDDLKQMYVYNHHFNAVKSVLVYPQVNEFPLISGRFRLPMHRSDGEAICHECHLAFAKLLENDRLCRGMASLLLGQILTPAPDPANKF